MNKAYKIKRMDIANENMLYRLSAFGLTDDAIITIKQKCLFKGPCIIGVNGQQLDLRHCDASIQSIRRIRTGRMENYCILGNPNGKTSLF